MDTKTSKKQNGKGAASGKATPRRSARSGRAAKKVQLTEEEIRAEKRRKLTLKVFRMVYEDHHKSD